MLLLTRPENNATFKNGDDFPELEDSMEDSDLDGSVKEQTNGKASDEPKNAMLNKDDKSCIQPEPDVKDK